MPPLPSVPNVLRIDAKFYVGSDVNISTRTYSRYTGGPPSSADCLAFATAALADGATKVPPAMGAETAFLGVSYLDLSSPSGGFGEADGTHIGTRAGSMLAGGTCWLLKYTIGRRYRGGKPRGYWPMGTSGDLTTPQLWNPASVIAFETAVVAWLEDAVVGTQGTTVLAGPCSVSYYEGFTAVTNPITGRTKDVAKLRTGGPVVDTITGYLSNPAPASQRRRN